MKRWAKFALAGVGVAGAGLGLTVRSASTRWDEESARLSGQALAASLAEGSRAISFERLGDLPAPVARYLRLVLQEGGPMIRAARLAQEGGFRTSPDAKEWSPLTAWQSFAVRPPGFVWDARIRMAPLTDVRVRDSYTAGQGTMRAKVLALVPVVDESGKIELAQGALQRYLGETVWFPTALLPGEGVEWSEIDADRSLATLSDSGVTVSLEFRFNEQGEVASVFSPDRQAEMGGRYVPTPWAVRTFGYREFSGVRIPAEAEAEWQFPEGNFPYWKARITEAEYEFAK